MCTVFLKRANRLLTIRAPSLDFRLFSFYTCIQLLYFAAIYLQFTQYDYTVHENESSVEVCAELFGIEEPTAAGVSVGVNTSDDTAIGKGGRGRDRGRGGREGGKREIMGGEKGEEKEEVK